MKSFNREELDTIVCKLAKICGDLGTFRDYFNGTMQSKFAYDNDTAIAMLEHDIEANNEILHFLQKLYDMCEEDENPLKAVKTSPLPTKNEYDDKCSVNNMVENYFKDKKIDYKRIKDMNEEDYKECCRLMKEMMDESFEKRFK